MKLRVVVHPNAKEEKILRGEIWHIYVKEPAKQGKANRRVIELLAQELGVPKSAIAIKAGTTGRKKVIEVINE